MASLSLIIVSSFVVPVARFCWASSSAKVFFNGLKNCIVGTQLFSAIDSDSHRSLCLDTKHRVLIPEMRDTQWQQREKEPETIRIMATVG